MRIFIAMFFGWLLASPAFGQDLVLINGRVIDGTGKARAAANVRIRGGEIVDIGPFKPLSGEMVLDVKGMIVAPGFIDLRTLSPAAIEADPAASALVAQGITTAVLGADGTGVYLVEEFMLPFDEKPPALNIAMLVGHATIRRQIMGPDYKRPATADEIQRMGELVSEAMKQGAFGFGTDLQNEPCSFSSAEELTALARATAKFGGTLVMSLRDETSKLSESVKEAIGLAGQAKVSVHVLTANKAALAEIEKARAQRVDISADSYSFAQLAREKGASMERAIQRMSGVPASRMAFRERGVLRKGVPADIVVFNPLELSAGMKYVFVNGTVVLKDGQPTDGRPGRALR